MSWEDNTKGIDGIANHGWIATHLGTYTGGIAEGFLYKRKRKKRNNSASLLLRPDKPAHSPRCRQPASPFSCPRIHLLMTIPHLK